jgi:pimeloyl-ACP methyl ester carboxylesterase
MTKARHKKRRTRLLSVTWILLALYIAACLGCAAFQRRMLYYPTNQSASVCERTAKDRGLERWKNSAGENIGWKRPAVTQPARGSLLITHGNGGCAVDRADFAKSLRESDAMDIFILEYPGFGDRTGVPSQRTLFDAAENAFQSLPKTAPIYLLGESLGTGVAAHLAGTHSNEIAGVVLFAPYNKLTDVAQYHVRILPARWLMVDHFTSAEYFSHYHGPLAIIVGGRDRVVPAKFGRKLFDGYAGPKHLWEIPDGDHESIHEQSDEFWKELRAFWQTNTSHLK